MFEVIRQRIVEIKGAPARAAELAAPRIQERLRSDSTTKRGNVPSYGEFGNVASTATASSDGDGAIVAVRGADWVMDAARKRGQITAWEGIFRDAAAEALAPKGAA